MTHRGSLAVDLYVELSLFQCVDLVWSEVKISRERAHCAIAGFHYHQVHNGVSAHARDWTEA